jgi:SET domain-containing protein
VDGKYMIGVYTLRPIAEGEEITFDYNSVTEVSTFLVPLYIFSRTRSRTISGSFISLHP